MADLPQPPTMVEIVTELSTVYQDERRCDAFHVVDSPVDPCTARPDWLVAMPCPQHGTTVYLLCTPHKDLCSEWEWGCAKCEAITPITRVEAIR